MGVYNHHANVPRPVPRRRLRGLLSAYMPGVLTRLLAGLLPAELGAYTAASGEAQVRRGGRRRREEERREERRGGGGVTFMII